MQCALPAWSLTSFFRSRFLWCHLIILLACGGFTNAATEKPHIIIVLTDDMGFGELGSYGGDLVGTPRLDQLAREGTRFTQFYAASPICSPSRAGFLTGMYPARWRLTSFLQTRQGNRGCEQADYLDPAAPSLPRLLKSAGYTTAHFGKWHLGGGRDVTDAPKFAAYGYDEHAATWESPEPDPEITASNWIWSDKDKVKRWDRTAFFVDKTLEFLKRNKGQPCFVNLWPDDVHTPWVPGSEAEKGDTPENLRGVLAEYDRQMGRLFDGLRELGIEKKTLVIFTSDNGALPTFGGSRSGGLRGSKLSLYEGGVRMPLIVRWPDKVPAGRVDRESVLSAVDFVPTLCAIAGVPSPDGLDGQDIGPAFLGKPISRNTDLYWEYGRNEKFFRYPKSERDRSPALGTRKGNWKLLMNRDGSRTELFDLESDPVESKNVAEKHPDVVAGLKSSLLNWRNSLPSE